MERHKVRGGSREDIVSDFAEEFLGRYLAVALCCCFLAKDTHWRMLSVFIFKQKGLMKSVSGLTSLPPPGKAAIPAKEANFKT